MLKQGFKYLSSTILLTLCTVSLCSAARGISNSTEQSERGDLIIDHVACILADGASMIRLRRGFYDYVEDGNTRMDYRFTQGRLKYRIHFDYDSFREDRSKGYIIIRSGNRILSHIPCNTVPKFWAE